MENKITKIKIFTTLAMFSAGVFACKLSLCPQLTTYAMESKFENNNEDEAYTITSNTVNKDCLTLYDIHKNRENFVLMLKNIAHSYSYYDQKEENIEQIIRKLKSDYLKNMEIDAEEFETNYQFLDDDLDKIKKIIKNFKKELNKLTENVDLVAEYLKQNKYYYISKHDEDSFKTLQNTISKVESLKSKQIDTVETFEKLSKLLHFEIKTAINDDSIYEFFKDKTNLENLIKDFELYEKAHRKFSDMYLVLETYQLILKDNINIGKIKSLNKAQKNSVHIESAENLDQPEVAANPVVENNAQQSENEQANLNSNILNQNETDEEFYPIYETSDKAYAPKIDKEKPKSFVDNEGLRKGVNEKNNALSVLNNKIMEPNSSAKSGTKRDLNTTTIENNEPEIENDEENASLLDETSKKYGGTYKPKKFFHNIFGGFKKNKK